MTDDENENLLARYALSQYSQLGQIVEDLLADFDRQVAADPQRLEYKGAILREIEHIIDSLRLSVSHPEADRRLLELPIGAFRDELSAFDAKSASRLSDDYDTIWLHRDSQLIVAGGNLDSQKIGELRASDLDDAAYHYLGTKLHSPRLEQTLIDGLLYAETVAYARSLPDVATATWASVKIAMLQGTVKLIWSAGKEAVALFLTAIAASVADSTHGVAFWVVFSAVTAVRWLRPKPLAVEKLRMYRLLCSMASVQQRLHHRCFNAKLIRELLYGLEKDGAVFSPLVYNLLDWRIAREAA